MANRKLTAGDSAKLPRRRCPAKTPYSSWQQVQRYGHQGRGKDCRDADAAKSTAAYTCSRYGETPNHGERQRSRMQRRCRCAPEVRPRERRCNTISALRRQMAVPTIAMLWRYLFSLARWRELARNDGADHGCACPGHNTERSPYRSDATQQVHRKKRKLTKRSARMADRYLPGAQRLRRA